MLEATAKNQDNETSASNRWWEQYYVRYFVGTVVGALALIVLSHYAQMSDVFKQLVPIKVINGWGLSAVAAAGLAYCYIASAPVLTLHAVRGGLALVTPNGLLLLSVFVAVFVGFPLIACLIAFKFGRTDALGWALTGECFIAQIILIAVAQRGRFDRISSFYDRLVEARRHDKAVGTDYRDSYRHMREHGNAKTIIICEIFLGVILASAENGAELTMMLVLWLIPSAYVWFLASILEAHFAATRG